MNLDHSPPKRLKMLDPYAGEGLSEAQRDAIARAVVAQAPALMRSTTTRQWGKHVAFAAAAAAALIVLRSQSRDGEQVAMIADPTPAATCALDAPASVEPVGNDSGFVQVGRARLRTGSETRLSLVESKPCLTRVAVSLGDATIDATDLGGGTLVIDTPEASLKVSSTVFRVAVLASATTVSVAQGKVIVSRSLSTPESVYSGEQIRVTDDGTTRTKISEADATSIRSTLLPEVRASVEEEEAPADSAPTSMEPPVRSKAPKKALKARAPASLSPEAWFERGEALFREGDRKGARNAFRQSAKAGGPTAEAAFLRLARLELAAHAPSFALSALQARKALRGTHVLEVEGLWLEVQALEQLGRRAEARSAAQVLVAKHPNTPQGKAAQRLLSGSSP